MRHLPLLLKLFGGLAMLFSACLAFIYQYSWTGGLFAIVAIVCFSLMDMGDSIEDYWGVRR